MNWKTRPEPLRCLYSPACGKYDRLFGSSRHRGVGNIKNAFKNMKCSLSHLSTHRHCVIYLVYPLCFPRRVKPYLRLSYYFSLQFLSASIFNNARSRFLKIKALPSQFKNQILRVQHCKFRNQISGFSIANSGIRSPGSALPIQEPDLRVQHCQFKNPNPWTRKYKFWRGKSCNETHLIPWDIFSERHIYDHFQFHQPKKTGTWFQNQSKGYAN